MNSILKQLLSLILPFTVLVIVPLLIENNLTITLGIVSVTGIILVTTGLAMIVITISMFIRIGRGTLAPWSPTRKLVANGIYAYVRNPMILGVFIVLIGESFTFHSINIFVWAIVFFVINSIYFVVSEEPGLANRFGKEYLEYKQNVPRWIPRLKPWVPS
jgi:protein-S-isoprenylcysteine O-methyltransferase Ste14